MNNYFDLTMPSDGRNESFARAVVAAFALACSPTVDQLNDLKTAVSEAVTNAVVHAYGKDGGLISLHCELDERQESVTVTVSDFGKGIADIAAAREPFFTTRPEDERSGMGFTIIETFTNEMTVTSTLGEGTSVTMKKVFKHVDA